MVREYKGYYIHRIRWSWKGCKTMTFYKISKSEDKYDKEAVVGEKTLLRDAKEYIDNYLIN